MKRSLLAILAHPDDESYGMGGTLARYAAEGVDVHVAIATDGAAGSVDETWQGDRSLLAEARIDEVKAASEVLGVTLHLLDYRDSGYIGDPANEHPDAFINSDRHESTGRIVTLIRRLKPQVLVTHDETGGYYHPDHIECYQIATPAFYAAGDPTQYPQIDLEPHTPKRLYYSAFSNRWVKILTTVMRLRGRDPTKAGRNKDIDFTKVGVSPKMITTSIDYRKYWDVKRLASAEHGSQGGGTSFGRMFPRWLQIMLFSKENYIRVYPAVHEGYRETDFFEGL